MKTELKVLLYLKRNGQDKEGLCPVIGKITIKGETNSTAQLGCKIKVSPELWNATYQRCTGKSKIAVTTNIEIETMLLRLCRWFDELCGAGDVVKAEGVKNFSQGIASTQITFMQLCHKHNEEYALRVGVNRVKCSYNYYLRLYSAFGEFLKAKYKVLDIPPRQLNLDFIEAFDTYQRVEKKLQPGTILKHIKSVKAIMNAAEVHGLV